MFRLAGTISGTPCYLRRRRHGRSLTEWALGSGSASWSFVFGIGFGLFTASSVLDAYQECALRLILPYFVFSAAVLSLGRKRRSASFRLLRSGDTSSLRRGRAGRNCRWSRRMCACWTRLRVGRPRHYYSRDRVFENQLFLVVGLKHD
jgi:hypothetical protein